MDLLSCSSVVTTKRRAFPWTIEGELGADRGLDTFSAVSFVIRPNDILLARTYATVARVGCSGVL